MDFRKPMKDEFIVFPTRVASFWTFFPRLGKLAHTRALERINFSKHALMFVCFFLILQNKCYQNSLCSLYVITKVFEKIK